MSGLMDVTRFNDTVPGLKAFQDNDGDIRMTFSVGDSAPIVDVNFSNAARRALCFFGLEIPVEKYGVSDRSKLLADELAQVQAEIKTIESNDGLTKEADARLSELRSRESDLVEELQTATD